MQKNRTNGRVWPRAVTLFGVLGLAGCTLIAGIEKREDDGQNAEYDTVDKDTDLPTTKLCVTYCDEVMGNCTEENEVYKSRINCINTCNALPKGEEDEPIGNTVWCRLGRAQAAGSSPDDECPSAGPSGGDGACGTACDAWCHLLESECPEDHGALANCKTACSTLPKSGGFNVDDNYTADTVECRLIHLGAVGEETQESPHCTHGRYIPAENCLPPEDDEPSCARYCDVNLMNCSEDAAETDPTVYESRDECMATCEALPLGKNTDTTENTVGCRIYHSKNAAGVPTAHCPHGGPSGDGHCGIPDPEETGFSGNCESYCYLFQAACGERFAADGYEDVEGCAQECWDNFEQDGAKNDEGYTVETATADDTVQCRIYQAVKLLGGDDDVSCDTIALGGSCD
jgi:hypothetical protein